MGKNGHPPSDSERYMAAAHAVLSATAYLLGVSQKTGTVKHIVHGNNLMRADHNSLVQLLIAKGVFTGDEYAKAIADGTEAEVEHLREIIAGKTGRPAPHFA